MPQQRELIAEEAALKMRAAAGATLSPRDGYPSAFRAAAACLPPRQNAAVAAVPRIN